jgi:hypothetical protein
MKWGVFFSRYDRCIVIIGGWECMQLLYYEVREMLASKMDSMVLFWSYTVGKVSVFRDSFAVNAGFRRQE